MIYTYLVTNGKNTTFRMEVVEAQRYDTLTALLNGGFAARLLEVRRAAKS